ncbi:mammalian cell entry protein [Shewanella mangrovi]|uniref:Mammalian cell entry protein n=2 Tax=Shewanella mangrovi TaxID=1515746 RepID=A0A094K1R7_9GAMM|nr:mammalian cell entry protein [Shewanella mangrovi]
MTHPEQPRVVRKKLFSPVWLLPLIALALGAWLGIKSIRESGIDVRVHFPSATGIDVSKTLVRYKGLNVGKVVDISIDDELKGVNVDLVLDYRANNLLKENTKFWLVTPKASITGVEGLDALFSGNYIGMLPGEGDFRDHFEAEREAPTVIPSGDGLVIELNADTLGSLDVGSPIFYRQIPVGNIVSYHLDEQHRIQLKGFVQQQYAHLVKQDSRFWNVSGVRVDASLAGIKVDTESIASILAGGIAFNSPDMSKEAEDDQLFQLYDSQQEAHGGSSFLLTADNAEGIKVGTDVVFRELPVGEVEEVKLTDNGVAIHVRMDRPYSDLIGADAQFWVEGAQLSLSEVKHPERLISGNVIRFTPGAGKPQTQYPLRQTAPETNGQPLQLTLTASENPGAAVGADIRYRNVKIGEVTAVKLSDDFNTVNISVDIDTPFTALITQGSDFIVQSPLKVKASLDGVEVSGTDVDNLTKGRIDLRPGKGKVVADQAQLPIFASADAANRYYLQQKQLVWTLHSPSTAVNSGSDVYYKKMQIGKVTNVKWQASDDSFAIKLAIDPAYQSLLNDKAVFWPTEALSLAASLNGIDLSVAPLGGVIKGGITLGLLPNTAADNHLLYASKTLAEHQSVPVALKLPLNSGIKSGADIRYQGNLVGSVAQVQLSEDMKSLTASAYLYGRFANQLRSSDSHYQVEDAQLSLNGVKNAASIITGPFISVVPGKQPELSKSFTVTAAASAIDSGNPMTITLVRNELGSIKQGTGIFYRGIRIGEVTQYQLSTEGQQVVITALIAEHYQHLINASSHFYDLSGIKIDAGIFSGLQVETGSVENIITGGIGVATEFNTQTAGKVAAPFTLESKPQSAWLNWTPAL